MSIAVLRHSPRDAILISLAVGYGAVVLAFPSIFLIALGVWWIANTVAHNFIHLPFFRSRTANRLFSAYLSLLLGVPQTLWRDRHLAHHANRTWRLRVSQQLLGELLLVLMMWLTLAVYAPSPLLLTCSAGWCGGMLLCLLQGHYEHARGTVSHYGRVYNTLFFNDGFHVEHHQHPTTHWSELPEGGAVAAEPSRWPAVLRWLEVSPLDALERLVLRSTLLQRFVQRSHEQAFRKVLAALPTPRRITIVGGGLYPRTVLILRRLIPSAELTVIDRSTDNLQTAAAYLDPAVRIVLGEYTPGRCAGADLVILPLAFDGDRRGVYANPPAPAVAIHDWAWHRYGIGFIVSPLLLKRINLVRQ